MGSQIHDDGSFDYILIGGGTSGLVVASRLSEDSDVRVLVIEAGRDHGNDPLILTPGLMGAMYAKDEYDWNFASVPQPSLNNRTINQVRGKGLGGSSILNFFMTVYPSRANMDTWGALGNKGWNYDAMAPYFRKFAKTHPPPASATGMCRMDGHYNPAISESECGPVALSYSEGLGTNNSAWMDTFDNLGLKMASDPRSGTAVGAFQHAVTIDPDTKTRTYSASAYLTEEVRTRSNLVVMTDTTVMNVVLDKPGNSTEPIARGVRVRSKDGEESTIFCRLDVILAAGALHTPQILELSGIGDKGLLEKHGISVVVDNPNVGEHMQDHPLVCQSFEVADGVMSGDLARHPAVMQALIEQYQATREGPMGQSIISSAWVPMSDSSGPLPSSTRKEIFDKHLESSIKDSHSKCPEAERKVIRTLLETSNEPSFQLMLFPTQIASPQHPKNILELITPVEPENYITIMMMLNHPFSRGSCHITSPDVDDKPVWDPRFNAEAIDMEILARGVQFVETFIHTEPFAGLLKKDGKQLQIKGDSLDAAKEIIRQRQISVFHVSSSAAMLPKEQGGVVDDRLSVYGVKGLRVVDASVFPLEPLGNIQATVYAVAERAADILKEDRKMAVKTV